MSWLQEIKREYQRLTPTRTPQARAISHRPDLEGRIHILTSRTDAEQAPAMANLVDFARVQEQYVWLRKGIKVLSDNFAQLPLQVLNANDEPVENHQLVELFRYGNSTISAAEMWDLWLSYIIMTGDAFMEIVSGASSRQPKELWVRRPDLVGVVPSAENRGLYPEVVGYSLETEDPDEPVEYAPDEMIHWKFANPMNAYRGLSVVGAIRHSITIDIFGQAYSKSFLKRGGRPDWALVAPQGLGRTEREEYEADIIDKYQGFENWHRPIVLEDGITDIKMLSWPPKDIEWLEQRKMSRDEVAAMLGVPDILMGFGADTYDTEEKRVAALRMLWALTLEPLTRFRDSGLNTFFTKRLPLLKSGERIETDLSDVEALRTDVSELAGAAREYFAMGVPFADINEVLGLGFPMDKRPQHEVGFVTINLQPVEYVMEPPEPVPAALQPFAGGEPPEQPPEQPEEEGPEDEDESEPQQRSVALHKAPEYGSIEHRAYAHRVDMLTRPFERQMQRALKRFFQEQQNDISAAVRDYNKAHKQDEPAAALPPLGEIFDTEAERERFIREMRPFVTGSFEASGEAALALVLGPEANPFNLTTPVVRQAIDHILTHQAEKTNDTTFTQLIGLFQEAEAQGESIPQIMDRLSNYYGGRKSPYQTERIARTTMIGSHNAASLQAYSQSGVVYGHEWLAALDERVRDTHAAAHGQFKPLGGRFEVGAALLLHPGDPAGPPAEVVNCRCTTVPVTR